MGSIEAGTEEEIRELIRRETRLLNEDDLENWISLFAEDGFYWMPLEKEHTDPESHDSLIYDNVVLMKMRKFNIGNPLSPSMQNNIRSVRILSDVEISPGNEKEEFRVDSSVIAVINHRQQDLYAGKLSYLLKRVDGILKIKMKRVDLINADAPLDIIMMYI